VGLRLQVATCSTVSCSSHLAELAHQALLDRRQLPRSQAFGMWCGTTLKLRRPVSGCFFQPPGIPRCLLARGWQLSQLEAFAERREWEAGRSARKSRYPCHPDTATCVLRPSMPESGSLWSWSQVVCTVSDGAHTDARARMHSLDQIQEQCGAKLHLHLRAIHSIHVVSYLSTCIHTNMKRTSNTHACYQYRVVLQNDHETLSAVHVPHMLRHD